MRQRCSKFNGKTYTHNCLIFPMFDKLNGFVYEVGGKYLSFMLQDIVYGK